MNWTNNKFNKIKFLIYIFLICVSSVFFSDKVRAEVICDYSNNSTLTANISGATLESGNVVKFKYDNTSYSVNRIYGFSKSSEYTSIIAKDYILDGKCPKYLLIGLEKYHSVATGLNEWYVIFYNDMSDLNAGKNKIISEWGDYKFFTTLSTQDAIKDENKENVENGNINSLLQNDKKELEKLMERFNELACNKEETYDESSENYSLDVVTECMDLSTSLQGMSGSLSDKYEQAKDGGMSEEELSEYKELIEQSKDYVETEQSKGESTGRPNEVIPDLEMGGEYTCQKFQNTETYKFIKDIFFVIQIIVPVILLVLGSLDFVRAMAAQNDDAMKKAQGTFIKRLIIAVAIFIVPAILNLMFSFFTEVLGVTTCGIGTADTVETNNGE